MSIGFAVEAVLLLASAGLAVGAAHDLMRDPERLYGLITLTGLAMGVRNAVVRKGAERDLTTTVLTLTLTGIAADSPLAGGNNPGLARRTLSVVLRRRRPPEVDATVTPVARGFISGESLMGVLIAMANARLSR